MMKSICCCAWLIVLSSCAVAQADELVIGGYNVENVFDTTDDPLTKDFQPAVWNDANLAAKLTNLAKVVRSMNGGRGPDVLGLCEIENREVVEALVAQLDLDDRQYKIVHQDSPDERGIDCALIYDSAVFELAEEKFHPVTVQATRDILEARLRAGDEALHVFMNHWPSKNNPEPHRIAAAQVLRTRIDQILAAQPDADILCLGDFNETPDEPAVRETLRTTGTKADATGGKLFNSVQAIHQTPGHGTFVFDNAWGVIDHIIVSPGLLAGTGLRWKDGSTEVLREDFLLIDPPGSAIPEPRPTESGVSFDTGGFSDHLPVQCILTR